MWKEPFDQFLDAKGRRKGTKRKRKKAERVFEGQSVSLEGQHFGTDGDLSRDFPMVRIAML